MKQTFLILLSISIHQISGQKLNLSTELASDRYAVDEMIELTLMIDNIPTEIVSSNGSYDIRTKNQFIYQFYVTPRQPGTLLLGPFSINFNEETLISNELKLKIREKLRANHIKINCPNKVGVNEEFLLELISTKEDLHKIKVLENSNFIAKKSSSSHTAEFKEGAMSHKYSVKFKLAFNVPGEFEITSDWFENIPNNLIVRSEKIKISSKLPKTLDWDDN